MIELSNNQLVFSFPEVHEDASLRVEFQRTLRIPDDNREYPLPAGLGRFSLHHVDDYTERVPSPWATHGGVFLPMYQAEATWLNFRSEYPMAVKVAAGKINALTGDSWSNELSAEKQDYLVAPDQPWLDGFCVDKGRIRQFVAMPLDEGYTAEEQLTGVSQFGGLQIIVYPMKPSLYDQHYARHTDLLHCQSVASYEAEAAPEMGLAPGGLMRQEIFDDIYGLESWDKTVRSRCYIHILNSVQFTSVTGYEPPHEPPTPKDYEKAGLPWFEYYHGDRVVLGGSHDLAGMDSVGAKSVKKGGGPLANNESVSPTQIHDVGPRARTVREGSF